MTDIEINDYDYELPAERIAQYPVHDRDLSQLLIYKENQISKDIFRNIDNYIPSNALMIFNNTRVIRARILFRKETGSVIEVFCLEPVSPSDYESTFGSKNPVIWKCIIGNLKKWKSGTILTSFEISGNTCYLKAEKLIPEGDAWRVRFDWDCDISFGEVIEAIGHIPLPPYINREDEDNDIARYQTIYSTIRGSVAAPTAGLHFTEKVLDKLSERGIRNGEVTLHIGAGTFQPVRSEKISGHEMHCEHFFVTADTIELILNNYENIIAIGTTSVRTLESLYWLGARLLMGSIVNNSELSLGQWEPYEMEKRINVSVKDSMEALLKYLRTKDQSFLHASTNIIIIPGYNFRMIKGIVTNFHQPRSTLLLLVSAWVGKKWKEIYKFAYENNFRFLSYGDSSLLMR